MPSNVKGLKISLKKKIVKHESQNAVIQKKAAISLLTNLARFTPVRTGRLAGGYVILTRKGQRAPRRPANNKSRMVAATNLASIEAIDGSTAISIVNRVPYLSFVNDGTRSIRAQRFIQRAKVATARELQQSGIRSKVI